MQMPKLSSPHLQTLFRHPQLIGRAVEALLRTSQQQKAGGASAGWGGVNVLCYGFRKKRPAGEQGCAWCRSL